LRVHVDALVGEPSRPTLADEAEFGARVETDTVRRYLRQPFEDRAEDFDRAPAQGRARRVRDTLGPATRVALDVRAVPQGAAGRQGAARFLDDGADARGEGAARRRKARTAREHDDDRVLLEDPADEEAASRAADAKRVHRTEGRARRLG